MSSSFKPSILYAQDVATQKVSQDASQESVLKAFDRVYSQLENPAKPLWPFAKKTEIKGIYLYGKVGRGKTYLMDLFYESLTVPKLRLHFYEFMSKVHVELKLLQGRVNPLQKVVENFAKTAKVFCLDEFFVEDIADAMILASLLEGLFRAEVVVVTTSNVEPQNLYKDGLRRDRFLPAIGLIQKHMQVLSLDHPKDYRLLHDFKGKNYHFPLIEEQAFLDFHFHQLKGEFPTLAPHFVLEDRDWEAIARSEAVVWFSFHEICHEARSSLDYLALTEFYRAILIQDVPQLTESQEDAARRFIALIDTCYDRHVPVILAAAVSLLELYEGKRLAFEFERTQSRLIEMAGWI